MSHQDIFTESARTADKSRFHAIQEFRKHYYLDTLIGLDPRRIEAFVDETSLDNWRNPNLSVGGVRQRTNQSFRDPRATYSTINGNLQGLARFADNASSPAEEGRLLGRLERMLKLWTPLGPVAGSRYLAVNELIGESETIVSDLIGHVVEQASPSQPITVYVLDAEMLAIDALLEAGFDRNPDFATDEPVFAATADSPAIWAQQYYEPSRV